LDELGIAEKTLVIFTSDNGGAKNHGANNGPLRGAKGSTFEGGIRVPTLCRWPGKIPAGSRTSAITSMMDILPTLANLAGASLPTDRTIDGRDIWATMSSERPDVDPPRQEFLYFRGLKLEAIRRGNWKLLLADKQLFNLATDIGEAHDMAAQNPEKVAELVQLAKAVESDLGSDGVGPGCRSLGRVSNPVPLLTD